MTGNSSENLLESSDVQIINRAIAHANLKDEEKDELDVCKNLGYEIDRDLVEELMLIEGFGLDKYYRQVSIRFYTYPDEKDSRPSFAFRRKIKSMGDDFLLIALAHGLGENESVQQDTDGLILRRIKLPFYLAEIVKKTGLINCKSDEEILNYGLTELIDMFK
jgi:hypothetical protein